MWHISSVVDIKNVSNSKSALQTHSRLLVFMPFDTPYVIAY